MASKALIWGDARAIYHLVRHARPARVLEIGTHTGASTYRITAAMKQIGAEDCRLVTVDIMDVNDPVSKPWVEFGERQSPAELIDSIGCSRFVEFETSSSTEYLANCRERFDLIFLDGSHEAQTLYQEIPTALSMLNSGGLILMHDFYPNCRALWSNGAMIPGPFLAVQRLCKETSGLSALPLGELPWSTKLGSNITSLAVLLRR